MIYMIIAGYFEDDASDELANDPVFRSVLDTVRFKLLKIAAKVVCPARYITFNLCSSCSYKNEFYETLSNIDRLSVQLE